MDRRIPLTTRVAIIARVSTADENHTIEIKHRDLLVIAERQGCEFVATFTEEGISGLKSGTVFQILAFLLQGEGSCVGSERAIAATPRSRWTNPSIWPTSSEPRRGTTAMRESPASLLLRDGIFIQAIEGPTHAVKPLWPDCAVTLATATSR